MRACVCVCVCVWVGGWVCVLQCEFLFSQLDYERQLLRLLPGREKCGLIINNPQQTMFLFVDKHVKQVPTLLYTSFLIVLVCNQVWCLGSIIFCCQSGELRFLAHMLPGSGWCSKGLPLFPTACWWLHHPKARTCVSATTG